MSVINSINSSHDIVLIRLLCIQNPLLSIHVSINKILFEIFMKKKKTHNTTINIVVLTLIYRVFSSLFNIFLGFWCQNSVNLFYIVHFCFDISTHIHKHTYIYIHTGNTALCLKIINEQHSCLVTHIFNKLPQNV